MVYLCGVIRLKVVLACHVPAFKSLVWPPPCEELLQRESYRVSSTGAVTQEGGGGVRGGQS